MLAYFSQGTTVNVAREKEKLFVTVNCLSTERDDWLYLECILPELMVTRIFVEAVRNEKEQLWSGELNELAGLAIDFEFFAKTGELSWPEGAGNGSYYRRMLLEAVTAVLQSESFFYQERGFPCPADYDTFWKDFSRDSCCYYSNLDRVEQEFTQHIANQSRQRHLFSRQRNAAVEKAAGVIKAVASVRDSFHEMHTCWEIDVNSYAVLQAGGRILRAPDLVVCSETETLFEKLKGMIALPELRREFRSQVDGPQGCAHFGDLTMDIIWLLDAFRSSLEQDLKTLEG